MPPTLFAHSCQQVLIMNPLAILLSCQSAVKLTIYSFLQHSPTNLLPANAISPLYFPHHTTPPPSTSPISFHQRPIPPTTQHLHPTPPTHYHPPLSSPTPTSNPKTPNNGPQRPAPRPRPRQNPAHEVPDPRERATNPQLPTRHLRLPRVLPHRLFLLPLPHALHDPKTCLWRHALSAAVSVAAVWRMGQRAGE